MRQKCSRSPSHDQLSRGAPVARLRATGVAQPKEVVISIEFVQNSPHGKQAAGWPRRCFSVWATREPWSRHTAVVPLVNPDVQNDVWATLPVTGTQNEHY